MTTFERLNITFNNITTSETIEFTLTNETNNTAFQLVTCEPSKAFTFSVDTPNDDNATDLLSSYSITASITPLESKYSYLAYTFDLSVNSELGLITITPTLEATQNRKLPVFESIPTKIEISSGNVKHTFTFNASITGGNLTSGYVIDDNTSIFTGTISKSIVTKTHYNATDLYDFLNVFNDINSGNDTRLDNNAMANSTVEMEYVKYPNFDNTRFSEDDVETNIGTPIQSSFRNLLNLTKIYSIFGVNFEYPGVYCFKYTIKDDNGQNIIIINPHEEIEQNITQSQQITKTLVVLPKIDIDEIYLSSSIQQTSDPDVITFSQDNGVLQYNASLEVRNEGKIDPLLMEQFTSMVRVDISANGEAQFSDSTYENYITTLNTNALLHFDSYEILFNYKGVKTNYLYNALFNSFNVENFSLLDIIQDDNIENYTIVQRRIVNIVKEKSQLQGVDNTDTNNIIFRSSDRNVTITAQPSQRTEILFSLENGATINNSSIVINVQANKKYYETNSNTLDYNDTGYEITDNLLKLDTSKAVSYVIEITCVDEYNHTYTELYVLDSANQDYDGTLTLTDNETNTFNIQGSISNSQAYIRYSDILNLFLNGRLEYNNAIDGSYTLENSSDITPSSIFYNMRLQDLTFHSNTHNFSLPLIEGTITLGELRTNSSTQFDLG